MMLETLLKKEFKQYIGIIALTYHFQNATSKKGLELKHYRYALVQKDDLKRDKKALYNFFERLKESNEENHLKDNLTAVKYRMMCEMKEIEKCISSRQNLSKNYLKNLLDAGYLIKDGEERKTPVYYINPEKKKELDKQDVIPKKTTTKPFDLRLEKETKLYWIRAATGALSALIGRLLFGFIGWFLFLWMLFWWLLLYRIFWIIFLKLMRI